MAQYRFKSGSGETVQGWEAIVPILRADASPKQLTCIGTGFFIHTGGILVTAAHVVRDICGEDGQQSLTTEGEPVAGLMAMQYVPPDQMIRRDIVKVAAHLRADVAVAGVSTLLKQETGIPVRNKVLRLTAEVPTVGDYVATWAFPKSVHETKDNIGTVTIVPKFYEGKITCEYRNGRDSVMLPGPCYETNLSLEGGSSGGPVFDERGHVFAVNSTGIDGSDIAFVSHIQSICGLPIAEYEVNDGTMIDSITIRELIARNEILVK